MCNDFKTKVVNFLLSLRGYHGRRGKLRTRKNTELVSPSTHPAEECVRFSEFSPTPFQMAFDCELGHAGENSESAALGVECVLRKARDERRCAATNSEDSLCSEAVGRPLPLSADAIPLRSFKPNVRPI